MINSDDMPAGTPTMRGEHCEEVGPGGETCIFGRKHAAGHHLTPDGERWVSASTLSLRLRPGDQALPIPGNKPERDPRPQPVRDIEALRERILADGMVPKAIVGDTSPELRQRPGDQPLPIPNDQPDVQSMVIADIEARRELGIRRYGVALQPFNGRDALLDAYEEALDLAIYLRQVRAEQEFTEGGVTLQSVCEFERGHTYAIALPAPAQSLEFMDDVQRLLGRVEGLTGAQFVVLDSGITVKDIAQQGGTS